MSAPKTILISFFFSNIAIALVCSDVSQKARRPPTEFRGSVLGEEGDVSVRNERGSSDRTDAGTAPGVVARGRAAAVAETPDEPGRAKRGGPFEV